MKLVAGVRTFNEARNIELFCESYAWADQVLVCDGGSTDDTVARAQQFPNVNVSIYDVRVQHPRGSRRNPHGPHINYLIDWAFRVVGADWLIFDDCDCTPNRHLKHMAHTLLTDQPRYKVARACRLYLWQESGLHFPHLAQPHKKGVWEPSLWAWRRDAGIELKEDDPWKTEFVGLEAIEPRETLNILPPLCLLHRPWPDEIEVKRKLDFYRHGNIGAMEHPLTFGGPLEELPAWAVN